MSGGDGGMMTFLGVVGFVTTVVAVIWIGIKIIKVIIEMEKK